MTSASLGFFWGIASLSYRTLFLSLATFIGAFFLFFPPWVLSQKAEKGFNDKQNYPIERAMVFATLVASPGKDSTVASSLRVALDDASLFMDFEDATFLPMNVPLQGSTAKEIITYSVQPGDTIASIASGFGLRQSTVLWANNLSATAVLRPNRELIILPQDGVLHHVKKDETVGRLSVLYEVYTEEIVEANGLSEDALILEGQKLIIPGGKPLPVKPKPSLGGGRLGNFAGGFVNPAPGAHRSQSLHYNNAADLANGCGSPVVAVAPGVVIRAKASGWNGGFGNYVMLQHQGGIVTVYGHMQQVSVDVGEHIGQGSSIGKLGATGRATGCHVHFEVRGARNPFAY